MPGLALTAALGVVAWGGARAVGARYPRAGIDAVVLAVLAGVIVRAFWHPAPWAVPGIGIAARQVLEVAIVLLGVATDARWMARAGLELAVAIAAATTLALGAGLAWGRVFGLPRSHALLVASGNAISGNSAIAVLASVTGAPRREETASAVAYTALLSLALVLALPFVRAWLSLVDLSYGIVTGLTVYAVPQVLAAAYPVSVQAGQLGTMVKLARVLMLIPLVTGISLIRRRQARSAGAALSLRGRVPCYVLGFLVSMVAHSRHGHRLAPHPVGDRHVRRAVGSAARTLSRSGAARARRTPSDGAGRECAGACPGPARLRRGMANGRGASHRPRRTMARAPRTHRQEGDVVGPPRDA
jgi:uncharacterized membrane protein YadS